MSMQKWILLSLCPLFFLYSCKGTLKETENQKIKDANRVGKTIQRHAQSKLLTSSSIERVNQAAYPWQKIYSKNYPLITKEFFRCKGDSENPTFLIGQERLFDCNGSQRHSLPLKEGKEFVYPVLIEVLNYLQDALDAKVVITCGHRCPKHNRYSDTSEYNRTSKHMIGAEVDFYVQGYERKPQKVIETIMQFYQDEKYADKKNYQTFKRYTKKDLNVSTFPWFNQEIFIKLYQEHEGRDKDNLHKLPYVSIQVRYDPDTQNRVTYTWQQAFYNYLRE